MNTIVLLHELDKSIMEYSNLMEESAKANAHSQYTVQYAVHIALLNVRDAVRKASDLP